MSRRFPYLAAALVVLTAAVIIWLMSRTGHSPSAATAPSLPLPSLADDAAMLASASGKWQSDVVKMTVRDGTVNDRILGIEFVSGALTGQSNAPDARAKLFTSSLSKGIPDVAEASTSLGDGSFRDVRLQESNGVRTITITRTVDPNDPNPAKRQRIYDRFYSVSFRYELKNNVLTLKGFPGTNKVNWGVSEFIVPHEEITFKVR